MKFSRVYHWLVIETAKTTHYVRLSDVAYSVGAVILFAGIGVMLAWRG